MNSTLILLALIGSLLSASGLYAAPLPTAKAPAQQAPGSVAPQTPNGPPTQKNTPLAPQKTIAALKGQLGTSRSFASLLSRDGQNASIELVDGAGQRWIAPQAGCFNCNDSKRPNEWSPARISFDGGLFVIEYIDHHNNASWAYRASFIPDPLLSAPRMASFQKIGADSQGNALLIAIDFVSGTRIERHSGEKSTERVCRIDLLETPSFSKISLLAAREGNFEPPCASNTKEPQLLTGVR